MAVVHNHSYQVVPFSISDVPLRPMLQVAARRGRAGEQVGFSRAWEYFSRRAGR